MLRIRKIFLSCDQEIPPSGNDLKYVKHHNHTHKYTHKDVITEVFKIVKITKISSNKSII